MAARPRSRTRGRAAAGGTGGSERGTAVQSLVRALTILNTLAEAEDGASLSDIAQQVGLPPSTAHRLLTTLQQERFVKFDAERTMWSVGVQAFVVGNAFVKSRNLIQLARPHMRDLMTISGETVNLAVEDKGEAIFLAQVECRQMMRALVQPGARVALHCSGIGKALLAALPDAQLAKILHRHGLPRLTEKTIVKPADLRAELETARRVGYVVDDEEHAVGLRCVAAPLFDEFGEVVAAVSISGPAVRVTTDRIPVLGDLVRRTASQITAELGGNTDRVDAA